MALSIRLDRTWVIEYFDSNGDKKVRGGLCVSRKGLILTCWVDISSKDLRGRNHGSDIWFNLKILEEKVNFGLVLLKIKKPKAKISAGLRFSSFNLKMNRGMKIDLKRGDVIHGLFHREDIPFASFFGTACRPFRELEVEFPSMDSDLSLSLTGDAQDDVFLGPISFLCTKHVIHVVTASSDDDCESSDEHVSDEEVDEEDMDSVFDGDSEFDSDSDIKSDSDCGSDSDMDSDTDDSDSEDEYCLDNLHPDIPLIQVHGLETGFGSHGCPIFNEGKNIIGMFFFTKSGYQYVLPIAFLDAFLSHSISSHNKRRLSRKRKRKPQESDETWSLEDVEGAVNFEEKEDKKAKKHSHDPKCPVQKKELCRPWVGVEISNLSEACLSFLEENRNTFSDISTSVVVKKVGASQLELLVMPLLEHTRAYL